jgi:hypothetical protein
MAVFPYYVVVNQRSLMPFECSSSQKISMTAETEVRMGIKIASNHWKEEWNE